MQAGEEQCLFDQRMLTHSTIHANQNFRAKGHAEFCNPVCCPPFKQVPGKARSRFRPDRGISP